MGKFVDITGKVFGRLTVLNREANDKRRNSRWRCRCDCGEEVIITAYCLKRSQTKSCGCSQREITAERFTKHGLSSHPLYSIYRDMLDRCSNPSNKRYKDYGGRGISVCERWRNSITDFIEDMGPKPSEEHTLDRVWNNGNYEPSNCRWATQEVQSRNRRSNRYITLNGQRMVHADAANQLGIAKYQFTRAMEQLRKGKMPAIFSKVGDFSLEYL